MSKEVIELIVDGGKASATPVMAQKLGPLKISVPDVVGKINEKTRDFSGMKVPVKVNVDTQTKEVSIKVGTPPTAELIKKEAKIQKASGQPDKVKVGNLGIEQVVKIAKMKQDSMIVRDLRSAVQSVVGTCNSLGVLVEGKTSKEFNRDDFRKEIDSGRTEMSPDKATHLSSQLSEVQASINARLAKLKRSATEETKEAGTQAEKKEENPS